MCTATGPGAGTAKAETAAIPRIGFFTPGPTDLVRIDGVLEADERASGALLPAARRERDRALGRGLVNDAGRGEPDPVRLLLAWCDERDGRADTGGAMSTLAAMSVAVGALAGVVTASGAFFYDGSGRVNVLVVLGVFVAVPLATLVLFAFACLSRGRPRGLSPGRIGALIGRWLPSGPARALAALATDGRRPDVARWLLLTWSQWLAFGFGLGALGMALALVVFTDLAFGWSTTLDTDGAAVRALVHALACPWQSLLPDAVPSAPLIEASRYFRIAPEMPGAAGAPDPRQLGGWWPFVVLCMLVYGTLPRLFTAPVCHWRLARACRAALLADVRARELLDRMLTPLVETRADSAEVAGEPGEQAEVSARLPQAEAWQVVCWAAVPVDEGAVARLLAPARLLAMQPAGGMCTVAADRALVRSLAASLDEAAVLVVARGYDAPTLDLLDFLTALRDALPSSVTVALLPIAVAGGAPAALSRAQATVWAGVLAREAVEGVQLVSLEGSAEA